MCCTRITNNTIISDKQLIKIAQIFTKFYNKIVLDILCPFKNRFSLTKVGPEMTSGYFLMIVWYELWRIFWCETPNVSIHPQFIVPSSHKPLCVCICVCMGVYDINTWWKNADIIIRNRRSFSVTDLEGAQPAPPPP